MAIIQVSQIIKQMNKTSLPYNNHMEIYLLLYQQVLITVRVTIV